LSDGIEKPIVRRIVVNAVNVANALDFSIFYIKLFTTTQKIKKSSLKSRKKKGWHSRENSQVNQGQKKEQTVRFLHTNVSIPVIVRYYQLIKPPPIAPFNLFS
jgi:Zn-dependent peptidase ImmA (M78 family)